MSALNDGGAGLVYRGSLVFRRDSLGVLSFESAPIAAGRITATGVRYHVTDHLGSVRGVVDGATGDIVEVSDYAAYGERLEAVLPDNFEPVVTPVDGYSFRYHFTGQEDQGPVSVTVAPNASAATVPYTDFGARHYSPALRRWLVPDPLSEKYYDVSPYAYCAGDPVNAVDVDGKDVWEINNAGEIVNRINDTTRDAFYLMSKDAKGNYVRSCFIDGKGVKKERMIEFEYNTFRKVIFSSSNPPVTAFLSLSSVNSAKLFKFFADNMSVEFGLVNTLQSNNYVFTQHRAGEISMYSLLKTLDKRSETVTTVIHNHPKGTLPSGFNDRDSRGDKFIANEFPSSHGFSISYYVYLKEYSSLKEYTGEGIVAGLLSWDSYVSTLLL